MTMKPGLEPRGVPLLLSALTLEEKCSLVNGSGPFDVPGIERLEIPGLRLSDGPVGVRGITPGASLLLPCESLLGATWNPDLVRRVGRALGLEASDRNIDVVLGPTINLHRSPLGGRHFECYSEDPFLTAELAVAYIQGVQAEGVGACAKHFVCNDQELERTTLDVKIDDRTLREVYLYPFEAAVKRGPVRAVMAAYNYVNGHHATAQPELLVDTLKGEWGFDGVVMSDWGATKETLAPARHGLDLEMPGPGQWWGSGQLLDAIRRGDVDEALLDDKVRRILSLMEWCGRLRGPVITEDGPGQDREGDRALVRATAAEGMVLVKNDGVLPLAPRGSIALIGHGVESTALMGGGSASLTPYRTTNLLDALLPRWSGQVHHVRGIDLSRGCPPIPPEWISGPVRVELFRGRTFSGEVLAERECPTPSAVWMGEDLPEPRPTSARVHFSFVPDTSGWARVMIAGFGHATLDVDGTLAADNEVDSFSASLGLTAGTAAMVLEEGRTYQGMIEVIPRPDTGLPLVYFDLGVVLTEAPGETGEIEEAVEAARHAEVVVVVVGTTDEWESEDRDRTDLRLPLDQSELVRRVAEVNPRTVVVVNAGAPVEIPWLDDVAAMLVSWYPGQEGGEAIADVLLGEAEPGGRMPTTWARQLSDTPSYNWYPGADGVEEYGEGRLIGYRWYEAHDIDPLIAFGHGLSYTTFEWGVPDVRTADDVCTIAVPVTNTGQRPGSDVVQVYVVPVDGDVPLRLAGFAKILVEPGATEEAIVELAPRSFARFDADTRSWTVDPGRYRVILAASAIDHRGEVVHAIEERQWLS